MARSKNYRVRRTQKRARKPYRSFRRGGNMNSDAVNLKIEVPNGVNVLNTQSTFIFDLGNQSYYNVSQMLAASATFVDLASKYQRYRINGLSVKVAPRAPLPTTIPKGIPPIAFAFYPASTNLAYGDAPITNDKKFVAYPGITTPQTHYWRFPSNFFQSGNGGYGTWNGVGSYVSLLGQVSCRGVSPMGSASADTICYEVFFTLYVQFRDKDK